MSPTTTIPIRGYNQKHSLAICQWLLHAARSGTQRFAMLISMSLTVSTLVFPLHSVILFLTLDLEPCSVETKHSLSPVGLALQLTTLCGLVYVALPLFPLKVTTRLTLSAWNMV